MDTINRTVQGCVETLAHLLAAILALAGIVLLIYAAWTPTLVGVSWTVSTPTPAFHQQYNRRGWLPMQQPSSCL